MIAVDTNVLVRLVTRDDPAQTALAAEVMSADRVWLAKTVLLETEWVLRSAYGLSRDTVVDTLRRLVGYENTTVEDRTAVLRALDASAGGMDFADALHLASAGDAMEFATFDARLASRAPTGGAKVRLLAAPTPSAR